MSVEEIKDKLSNIELNNIKSMTSVVIENKELKQLFPVIENVPKMIERVDEVKDTVYKLVPTIEQIDKKKDNVELNEEQKDILTLIFDDAKKVAETIFNSPNTDFTVKVTKMIAEIIKLIEDIASKGKKINGSNKKQIALVLGRILINELVKDETTKTVILTIYDTIGETTLEIMVDVSRNLNVVVKEAVEVAESCVDNVKQCGVCIFNCMKKC